MAKRLTVKEASKVLDMNPDTLRRGMNQGVLPIGSVIKNDSKDTFYIYQEKIDQYLYGSRSKEEQDLLDRIIEYLKKLKEENIN